MRPKGFFYGWIIAAACFICCASYAPFYCFGIFFNSLQAEFGWSRALTSSVHSLHLIVWGLSSIFMGWLTDRYGPRLAIMVGAWAMGIGLTLCSQIRSIEQLYFLYLMASIGPGLVYSVSAATVQRWFVKKRGLVLGLVISGTNVGNFVMAPVTSFLISAYGWRSSYIILGLIFFVLLSLAAMVIVSSPEGKGLKPYGLEEGSPASPGPDPSGVKDASNRPSEQFPARYVLRTRAFLGICAIFAFVSLSVHLVVVHTVPFATDIGVSRGMAAAAFGFMNVCAVAGRLFFPTLADRIGWTKAFVICAGGATLTMLWLMVTRNEWMVWVFAIAYGLTWGGKSPLVFGMVGQFFGMASLAVLIGIVNAVGQITGGVSGPILGGFIFDSTGSYRIAFLTGAVFWAGAAALAMAMRPPQLRAAYH